MSVTLREQITEAAAVGDFHVIFYDGLDAAIVGLVTRFNLPHPVVLYDREKCLAIFMERDRMTREMAEEWMSFNVEGGWLGEATPAFTVPLDV